MASDFFAFIDPAITLYCRKRVSIGPLNSGMRRLAFSPNSFGSSGSPEMIHAYQPAKFCFSQSPKSGYHAASSSASPMRSP